MILLIYPVIWCLCSIFLAIWLSTLIAAMLRWRTGSWPPHDRCVMHTILTYIIAVVLSGASVATAFALDEVRPVFIILLWIAAGGLLSGVLLVRATMAQYRRHYVINVAFGMIVHTVASASVWLLLGAFAGPSLR